MQGLAVAVKPRWPNFVRGCDAAQALGDGLYRPFVIAEGELEALIDAHQAKGNE